MDVTVWRACPSSRGLTTLPVSSWVITHLIQCLLQHREGVSQRHKLRVLRTHPCWDRGHLWPQGTWREHHKASRTQRSVGSGVSLEESRGAANATAWPWGRSSQPAGAFPGDSTGARELWDGGSHGTESHGITHLLLRLQDCVPAGFCPPSSPSLLGTGSAVPVWPRASFVCWGEVDLAPRPLRTVHSIPKWQMPCPGSGYHNMDSPECQS